MMMSIDHKMNGHECPRVSLVIPVYNEAENVTPLLDAIENSLAKIRYPYEIIFVDDGSTDSTFLKLCQLWEAGRPIKVIRLSRNFGQTCALSAGFEHSRGEIVVTMDGDLQNDPSDIPGMIEKLNEGYDIVSGWRVARQDRTLTKKLPSRIANWMIRTITGVNLHDYGCSLKVYRGSIARALNLYSDMHRFIPAIASIVGARIGEMKVKHHPRRHGYSKYGLNRVWKVLFDLVTIKLLVQFSSRPSHWFGFCALPFGLIGAVLTATTVKRYIDAGHEGLSVILPSLCLLLLGLAAHLVMLGLCSELILRAGRKDCSNAVSGSGVNEMRGLDP